MTWHEDHQTLVDVAKWATDEGIFTTAEAVVDFFEKPWRWPEVYDQWRSAIALGEIAEMAEMANVRLPVISRGDIDAIWDPDKGGLIHPGCEKETCFEPAVVNVDGENLCADHVVELAHFLIHMDQDVTDQAKGGISLWSAHRPFNDKDDDHG